MTDKAILVVSFGTSYKETREKTIDAVEKAVASKYPDWKVARAFTSRMIIKKLKDRDGIQIDYITDAFQRLIDEGVRKVVVLPTHVMNGIEYEDVARISSEFKDRFDCFRMCTPLLTTEEDYDAVIDAIDKSYLQRVFNDAPVGRAMVFMGHGTEHFANACYCELQMKLSALGYQHVYVTTVEGFPSFEDTMAAMASHKYNMVYLAPFMLVAGDHAVNDMAGDEEDSLRSKFIDAGCEVECILEGLGEQKAFQDLFLKHLENVIKQ
ncbi:sirohydrochlorin cobaltochelatase [Methanomassiliicoccales archaeon LGM-RCC1]|nr:sirohydrochlorin cobaltochelatase [Methanomassiliicoccales archaeon LGM-RCC1]